MKPSREEKIRIIPIGGLGAIGTNMTVFECGDDMIIVDCGIMFPGEGTPGIDYIIPDFSYILSNRHRVRAVFITHGHEDHIGAVPFLLNEVSVPLYATRLTMGLIQNRLEERPPHRKPELVVVETGTVHRAGAFEVEFLAVNHSIIDGAGLAITTETGTIIHTGDFKIDYTPVDGKVADINRLAEYGKEGVLLLMSDSTNAEHSGYTRSESVLKEKLVEIFSSSKGRIIVATFASNIHRIQQIMDAAQKYNKKVTISGATMQKNVEIARNLGYLTYRDEMVVDVREANKLPDRKLVIICTGSQGEPMSALARMASNTHRNFTAAPGDTVVITASVIPGNERMVYNVINSLMKVGAEVYYEQDEDIHVSGHASQEELKLMISLTRPKFFMPIHGEFRHLRAHARIAESLNIRPSRILIAENGQVLELSKKEFVIAGAIPLSRMYVDGQDIESVESGVISERMSMSSDGIVIVTVIISRGQLVRQPSVIARGFVTDKNAGVVDLVRMDVEEQIQKHAADGMRARDITAFMKKSLKNHIYKLTGKNPFLEIQVFEV